MPLGDCNFLQALFQEREQRWSILLLVGRETDDHLVLEIWECHCQKNCWCKAGLVMCNTARVLLTVGSEGDFDVVGLFQPVLNDAVRQSIGTKRGPLVIPPKLG